MTGGPAGVPDAHDLTWRELADALLLASVMQDRPPVSPRPEENRTPVTDRRPVTESESDEPVGAGSRVPRKDDERVELIGLSKLSAEHKDGAAPSGRMAFPVLPWGPEPEPGPAGTVQPEQAQLIRALRPFKRKVRSLREDDVELDEARTAEEAVESGRWFPVTTPAKTRWLDLTVVIDAAPSLALWRARVADFVTLLERVGAFRSVQLRLLDTGKAGYAEDGTLIGPVLRGGTTDTPPRGPAELLDPSGRRLVLVLTDGVGDAWRRDLVSPVLALWARAMPVAVVHLLPQRLWHRGGLDLHQCTLTSPGPLRPNRRYHVELADAWLDPEGAERLTAGAVAVPVLELEPRWLRWWAALVTGGGDGLTAKVLFARDRPLPADSVDDPGSVSAHERVKRFRSLASPGAYRLATLLAAVPVSTGVARALQADLVAGSSPAQLAEVFTSGLFEPSGGADWNDMTWEVPSQVREVLLGSARRSETVMAVETAFRRLGGRHPALSRIRDALLEPDSTPDPPAGDVTDVALERAVMRALSGPYLSRADRLDAIAAAGPGPGGERESTVDNGTRIEPVSDTMSQAPERTALPSEPTVSHVPVTPDEIPPVPPTTVVATVGASPRQERRVGDEAPPVWGAIPPKNPNFTGRRELLSQLGLRLGAGT
ncbi:MAG TPA: SAV_2336 N-terminal domain-related protein, partial [Amycolatopsis sp.]|nr:SAV_2336 N-terminal domain-related protein [Amycolatopsis sp.]